MRSTFIKLYHRLISINIHIALKRDQKKRINKCKNGSLSQILRQLHSSTLIYLGNISSKLHRLVAGEFRKQERTKKSYQKKREEAFYLSTHPSNKSSLKHVSKPSLTHLHRSTNIHYMRFKSKHNSSLFLPKSRRNSSSRFF